MLCLCTLQTRQFISVVIIISEALERLRTLGLFLLDPTHTGNLEASQRLHTVSSVSGLMVDGIKCLWLHSPVHDVTEYKHYLDLGGFIVEKRFKICQQTRCCIRQDFYYPVHVVRPPDIVVGGLIFYHVFFFLFSPSNLRVRWTELNENRPHGRK